MGSLFSCDLGCFRLSWLFHKKEKNSKKKLSNLILDESIDEIIQRSIDPKVFKYSSNLRKDKKKVNLENFKIEKKIGKGSFGSVFLVKNKENLKYYALKILKKEDLISRNILSNVLLERNIMKESEHPFIVNLKYAFQNDQNVFFVMDYLRGGELFFHLKKQKKFSEEIARFYSAEVVLALDYLHTHMKIVYRDLKPENILLTEEGHIKLIDFGLSKCCKQYSTSFCGTPEYLAPEILLEIGHNTPVDWWSLGCLLFEMITGKPPFYSKDKAQLYELILRCKPNYSEEFSEEAKDLISNLIVKNPAKRFNGKMIKHHKFFTNINWSALENKLIEPPIKLMTFNDDDTQYFNLNSKKLVEDSPPKDFSKINQNKLKDFSYNIDEKIEIDP